MASSNYPPGFSGGVESTDDAVKHRCKNGHEWTAAMWNELGGWFYVDESKADCPECGEEGEIQS